MPVGLRCQIYIHARNTTELSTQTFEDVPDRQDDQDWLAFSMPGGKPAPFLYAIETFTDQGIPARWFNKGNTHQLMVQFYSQWFLITREVWRVLIQNGIHEGLADLVVYGDLVPMGKSKKK